MTNFVAVAFGGAVGAILRYLLAVWASTSLEQGEFPWGTLAANLVGAFLIGLMTVLFGQWETATAVRLFLLTGLFGALTTFSTLMLELVLLYRYGHTGLLFTYLSLSLAAGLVLAGAGLALGERLAG